MYDDGHSEGPFWITLLLACLAAWIILYAVFRDPGPVPDPRHSVSTFR